MGELHVEAIARKVGDLLRSEGDPNAHFPITAYAVLYGPESYMSAHGGIGAIKQHLLSGGEYSGAIAADWTHRHNDHRLELATAMVASLANRVAEELHIDHRELDDFAASWRSHLDARATAD